MKKLLISLLLTSALATGMCVTAGCDVSSTADRSVTDSVATTDGFYSYAAASVGSIISSNVASAEQTASTQAAPLSAAAMGYEFSKDKPTQTEPTEEQLATINGYMSLVENLLGDGKANSVIAESDREGYEVKETVSFSDLEGNLLTYTMYYNRTVISVETEEEHGKGYHGYEYKGADNRANPLSEQTDDSQSGDEGEQADGELPQSPEQPEGGFKFEIETEYSIEGIMIVGEEEYALEGRYETESSHKGEESESFFKVTLAENSFIIMEQETEDDEQSFVYGIYTDGKLVESVKFCYENERNETELKMTVLKDGEKSELRFKDETERNGMRKITVKADMNGENINFTIFVTTDEDGNEVYRYQFGEKIKDMFKPDFRFGGPEDNRGGNVAPEGPVQPDPEQPVGPAPEQPEEPAPELPEGETEA